MGFKGKVEKAKRVIYPHRRYLSTMKVWVH
jgi:hypothetical protein